MPSVTVAQFAILRPTLFTFVDNPSEPSAILGRGRERILHTIKIEPAKLHVYLDLSRTGAESDRRALR